MLQEITSIAQLSSFNIVQDPVTIRNHENECHCIGTREKTLGERIKKRITYPPPSEALEGGVLGGNVEGVVAGGADLAIAAAAASSAAALLVVPPMVPLRRPQIHPLQPSQER